MAASTSVHSNALNFMSCLKSGVDPRTGLYNISISMPDLQSNDLRGPGFRLDLSYNQLNTLDSGYPVQTLSLQHATCTDRQRVTRLDRAGNRNTAAA
ncbi:hypothetical protein [Pseudomonas syringae]|uniref:hypothetical protein n=1 Tax=Pseudomonas syringae TaxID=317 RepID=UPI000B120469|nr:hypothetical protein [Pseudomonas syringae]